MFAATTLRWIGHARDVVIFVIIPGLLSLADMIDVLPVRPLLEHYLGTDNTWLLVAWYTLFFGTLRYLAVKRPRGEKQEGAPF